MGAPRNDASNLQVRVIDEIRHLIVSAELIPGAQISESALAESFGVSRTPVREALKKLQAEGLVETRPRVGTFVTTPSRREIVELVELRAVIEGAAARAMAEHGAPSDRRRLAANLADTTHAVETHDRREYVGSLLAFHELLVLALGNAKMKAHYRMLVHQLAYARTVDLVAMSVAGEPYAAADHARIHACILEGNGDTAEQLMREHVRGRGCALEAGLADFALVAPA